MQAASSDPLAPPPSAPANRPGVAPGIGIEAAFDAGSAHSVGIEDEVMLLDPDTLELVARGPEVLDRLDGDERFKLELPASQLEIVTSPRGRVGELAQDLYDGRGALVDVARGVARPVSVPVHPFSTGLGELNQHQRYEYTFLEYGQVARRQLVCALQVHVGIGDARRALAVYNVARSYLPLIAALAANAPFYEGRDTGLASLRPKLAELLPRQGVPPPIDSWRRFEEILAWGAASGNFPSAQTWWWELRPHPSFGTLEFRVPDAQSTVADAVAIAAVVQALVAWLGERHDAGQRDHVAETWRIEENRWSACRHGLEGTMADLQTGARRPTRDCVAGLFDALDPWIGRLGSRRELDHARSLISVNGAIAQRRAAGAKGARAATRWLVERFLDPPFG